MTWSIKHQINLNLEKDGVISLLPIKYAYTFIYLSFGKVSFIILYFRFSLSPALYLPLSLTSSQRFIPLMLMDNLPLLLSPPCLSNQKSIKNTSPPSLQSQALVEGGIETIPEPLSLPLTISRLSYSLPLPPSLTYGLPISPPKLRPPVYWKLAT